MRRSFARLLLLSALVVGGALAAAGMRLQQVQLAYRLDGLRAERAQTQTLLRQLEVEVAALQSPGRLEARARQLGLTPPAADQVRFAREYVAGTTGMAAARLERVEAFAR